MDWLTVEILIKFVLVIIAVAQIYGTAKLKSIASEQGKIKTQVNNLPDLESIAEAQAKGKSSVEFKYQKMKDDSVKLMEFYGLIQNYQSHILKKEVELGEEPTSNCSYSSYANLVMDEANKLNEIEIVYAMHFEGYAHEIFNKSYSEWMDLCKLNIKSIMELEIEKIELNENKITQSEYNILIDKFKNDNAVKTRTALFHALNKNISKLNNKILQH